MHNAAEDGGSLRPGQTPAWQRPRLPQCASTWVRGSEQLRQKPVPVRAVCAFQHGVHGRKLCWASNGSRPRQRRRAAQRPEQRRLSQSALLIPSVVSAVSSRSHRTLSAAVRHRLSNYLMHQPGSKVRPAATEKGANYQAQHRRNPNKREDDENELHLDSPIWSELRRSERANWVLSSGGASQNPRLRNRPGAAPRFQVLAPVRRRSICRPCGIVRWRI